MEIHELAADYFAKLPVTYNWPEMVEIFHSKAAKKPAGWKLAHLACESVGGEDEWCVPAVAAVGCMQISIIYIDDMLDEDPRGKHLEIGSAATMAISGPRFFGFVIGGSLPATLACNWLATAWDQNSGLRVATPVATVLEDVLLKARLRMGGASEDEIDRVVGLAWARGELTAPRRPGINYMLSQHNKVPVDAKTVISYQPHVMFYVPYLSNIDLGANPMGSAPVFVVNEGQPNAYVIVPVSVGEEKGGH